MPELISAPVKVPVPGGKLIEEYVGRVANGSSAVSVAWMHAPGGWAEPPQAPDFDEITLVLSGVVRVEHDDGVLDVAEGQAVVTRAGERVRFSAPAAEGASYIAICLPAFAPELAHRDGE